VRGVRGARDLAIAHGITREGDKRTLPLHRY
jgi:hypothetical protein